MGNVFSSIGGIVGGVIGGKEKGRAIDSQKAAVRKLQSIDIEKYKSLARIGDKEAYLNKLADTREADPVLAALRDESQTQLLNLVKGTTSPAKDLLNELVEEGRVQVSDPRYRALEDALISKARTRLEEGATLPPEFQAELVRSGLETGATVNPATGTYRQGPLAQILGNKIGAAQLALRAQRENEAQTLANSAALLKNNRLAILSGLLPAASNERAAELNIAGKGLATALEVGPSGGLAGRDILNLEEANRELANQKISALGNLSAQRHLKRAEEAGQLGNSIGGLLDSATGIFGGLGGFGGGKGSGLASLFGGAQQPLYGQGMPGAMVDYGALGGPVSYNPNSTYIPSNAFLAFR